MRSIVSIRGMSDEEYLNALDAEEYIANPLDRADLEIEDAISAAQDCKVDNAEQRAYIRSKVDSMIYRLKTIQHKLEG
jgi:hypothetical protein